MATLLGVSSCDQKHVGTSYLMVCKVKEARRGEEGTREEGPGEEGTREEGPGEGGRESRGPE